MIRRSTTGPDAKLLFDSDHNIDLVNGVEGVNCLLQVLENAGNPGVDILINDAEVVINLHNTLDVNMISSG